MADEPTCCVNLMYAVRKCLLPLALLLFESVCLALHGQCGTLATHRHTVLSTHISLSLSFTPHQHVL